jgi:hypothetical protein
VKFCLFVPLGSRDGEILGPSFVVMDTLVSPIRDPKRQARVLLLRSLDHGLHRKSRLFTLGKFQVLVQWTTQTKRQGPKGSLVERSGRGPDFFLAPTFAPYSTPLGVIQICSPPPQFCSHRSKAMSVGPSVVWVGRLGLSWWT